MCQVPCNASDRQGESHIFWSTRRRRLKKLELSARGLLRLGPACDPATRTAYELGLDGVCTIHDRQEILEGLSEAHVLRRNGGEDFHMPASRCIRIKQFQSGTGLSLRPKKHRAQALPEDDAQLSVDFPQNHCSLWTRRIPVMKRGWGYAPPTFPGPVLRPSGGRDSVSHGDEHLSGCAPARNDGTGLLPKRFKLKPSYAPRPA